MGYRRDAQKIQAALTKATEHVGSSFVDKNKDDDESGRKSYLDIKEYMYGTQSVEDQKTLLLTDIAKVKFDGGRIGKSFEDCCGDLRTLHQSLADISRPQSDERKVLDLLDIFRRPDSILSQGIQSVRTDFNGKRLDFEAAARFLKEFLPKANDPARRIKAVDVDGMPRVFYLWLRNRRYEDLPRVRQGSTL